MCSILKASSTFFRWIPFHLRLPNLAAAWSHMATMSGIKNLSRLLISPFLHTDSQRPCLHELPFFPQFSKWECFLCNLAFIYLLLLDHSLSLCWTLLLFLTPLTIPPQANSGSYDSSYQKWPRMLKNHRLLSNPKMLTLFRYVCRYQRA